MKKFFSKGLVALVFALMFIPFASKAVTTETIGILPAYPDANVRFSDAWFIYDNFDLGQTKTDAIKVINNKPETVVLKLLTLDAISTPDGSFALAPDDVSQKEVGNWIKLALTEIELAPKSEKLVPFTVTIPKDADVGDHMGGIAMQELDADKPIQGTGFKIITRVGVRMYITVPGEVRKESNLTRFDYRIEPNNTKTLWKDLLDINKRTYFFVGVQNKGNVKIAPRISLELRNLFGQKVFSVQNRDIGGVFPRSENNENAIIWDKMPIFGRYTATVDVSFPDQGLSNQTKEIVIWAFPYRAIFLLVIIGVLLALGRLIRKYFLEASKEKMPIYKVNPGDTLGKLSDRFSVSWKKLALVNEISKPFEIHVGEKLFIPIVRSNKLIIEAMMHSGNLDLSLADRTGFKKSKKKIIIISILVIVGVLAILGIRWRNAKVIRQEVKTPAGQIQAEEPKETSEKTKSGTFKKSSLSVVIANSTGEADSNSRLLKKLKLIGYNVSQGDIPISFSKTTIEYKLGKEEQAKMLQKDLGISEQADLKEYEGLSSDLAVFNLASKDEFLDFELSKMMVLEEQKQEVQE